MINSDIDENIVIYENCKTYKGILIDSSDKIVINFPRYFSKDSKKIYDEYRSKINKEYIIFEEPVFIIEYNWSYNYQHNYLETLPNILYYIELLKQNPNIYLICNYFKDIYIYIFNIYNLDINLIKSNKDEYMFKKVYISKHSEKFINMLPTIRKECMILTNNIRCNLMEKFKDKIDSNVNKLIYINRKNNLVGRNRFIINDSELIDFISNKSFEITTFEDMSLEEKFISTLNSKVVISPLGANLTNFYFSYNNSIKLFIILVPFSVEEGNKLNKLNNLKIYLDKNINILIKLGNIDNNIIKLVFSQSIKNNLSSDPVNNPYIVNITELNEILQKYS